MRVQAALAASLQGASGDISIEGQNKGGRGGSPQAHTGQAQLREQEFKDSSRGIVPRLLEGPWALDSD